LNNFPISNNFETRVSTVDMILVMVGVSVLRKYFEYVKFDHLNSMIYNTLCLIFLFCSQYAYSQKITNIKSGNQYGDQLPIKPTRTITFDTDEGSMMDVSVSPDNSTVLFTLLGDLYKVPSVGGVARQLTKGMAINRCPVWSPDGKMIAYISDGTGFVRLQIMDTAGSFRKVLGANDQQIDETFESGINQPVWLPDNKWISIRHFLYSLAGTKSVLPKEIEQLVRYSEDGNFIYGLTRSANDDGIITRYDCNTGIHAVFANTYRPLSKLLNPRLSPDGHWLTYMLDNKRGGLDSMIGLDLKNGKEKLLARLNISFAGSAVNQYYSFTSDSKELFIGYDGIKFFPRRVRTRLSLTDTA